MGERSLSAPPVKRGYRICARGALPLAPSSLKHDTGAHPENASRLLAVEAALDQASWPGLVCLEGGYAPDALAASVVATITALGSDQEPPEAPPEPAGALANDTGRAGRSWTPPPDPVSD